MKLAILCVLVAGIGGGSGFNANSLGDGIGKRVQRSTTVAGSPPVITMDAMPYTRTVTCTGSYTITGTATNTPTSVTWAASPDGASGSCTGTSTWSCAAAVSPNAAGEGVETITITASNADGSDTDTVDIGYYVTGSHSCFLSQSVNGAYNTGLSASDPVSTWENLGSSALDMTSTLTQRPLFTTSCSGASQPCVTFDGSNDRMSAASAADWVFLNNGTDWTIQFTYTSTSSNPNDLSNIIFTARDVGTSTQRGLSIYQDDRSGSGRNDRLGVTVSSGTAPLNITILSADNGMPSTGWNMVDVKLDDDGSTGTDAWAWTNNASVGSAIMAGTYSSSNPGYPLLFGDEGVARTFQFGGALGDVLIYQSALTDTQRQINQAVADWAAGDAIVLSDAWLFIGDSLTAGSGGVTTWVSKLSAYMPSNVLVQNRAVSGKRSDAILTEQWRAGGKPTKLFVLGGINDIANDVSGATALSNLETIYTEAAALGVTVYAIATLPFGDAASWNSTRQTQLEVLNNGVMASTIPNHKWDWYDLMNDPADLDAILSTHELADGVHPNDTGTTAMANDARTNLGL